MNDTIAGLPAEKFINRRVRLVNQYAGHRKPATLLEVHGNGKVGVKPDKHKEVETVEIGRVHPWWSKNPDLKQEHDDMVAREETTAVADIPDDQIALQPAPGMNHAAWVLGHLACTADMLGAMIGLTPICPPEWASLPTRSWCAPTVTR